MTTTLPDFAVVVPATWWAIPLGDEGAMGASVDALIDRQFRGVDNQPLLRQQTAAELRGVAAAAAADNGVRLWLSTEVIDGVALAASLVARFTFLPSPGADGDAVAALAASLAHLDGVVSQLETRAGRAVTRRRLRPSGSADLGASHDQTQLEVWLPTAAPGAWLALVFSTPYEAGIADALVSLFEAVAVSVEWLEPR